MEMCEVLIVDIDYWFLWTVYIIPVSVTVVIIICKIVYILFYMLLFVIQLSFFFYSTHLKLVQIYNKSLIRM